jgi:hypothetical protein
MKKKMVVYEEFLFTWGASCGFNPLRAPVIGWTLPALHVCCGLEQMLSWLSVVLLLSLPAIVSSSSLLLLSYEIASLWSVSKMSFYCPVSFPFLKICTIIRRKLYLLRKVQFPPGSHHVTIIICQFLYSELLTVQQTDSIFCTPLRTHTYCLIISTLDHYEHMGEVLFIVASF